MRFSSLIADKCNLMFSLALFEGKSATFWIRSPSGNFWIRYESGIVSTPNPDIFFIRWRNKIEPSSLRWIWQPWRMRFCQYSPEESWVLEWIRWYLLDTCERVNSNTERKSCGLKNTRIRVHRALRCTRGHLRLIGQSQVTFKTKNPVIDISIASQKRVVIKKSHFGIS